MSRIKKLETHYQQKLKNHDVKNTSEFIQSILDADITKGKYARFLIDSFLNDKFLEEDLIGDLESTVGQAVSLFDKHKGKLPLKQRSVYALDKETGKALYQSPGDLWNSVKQYQDEKSGKELKKEEQEQIYRETEFVYKDEKTGFQIISPLTENSAKWWGKGTRWCTSADNDNMFWNYAEKAPLLILLIPTNNNVTKLQLWKNKNNIQFMDEADKTVTLECIEKKWNLLESICLWLNDIKYIPESVMTKDICELVVKNKGKVLQNIPEGLRTKELCELAVKNDGYALQFIPEEYKTKEICEIAVNQDGDALKYVPENLRTKELCELAVQQNGWALHYIPKEYRTKELCEVAVQQNGWALRYIPEELRTKELCEMAVKNNGFALRYIPEELKTKELCEIAVQQDGEALYGVPKELRTKELCELAVKQNGLSLEDVPKNLITKELCELAVQQNAYSLQNIPESLITKALCKQAVNQDGFALRHIPEELKTKEICELAVKQDGEALFDVPEELKTKKLCEVAVKQNSNALRYVPNEFKKEIIKNNQNIFQIDKDKYQVTFKELKNYFPTNSISLDSK